MQEHRRTVAVVGMGAIGSVVAEALDHAHLSVTSCRRNTDHPMTVVRDGEPHRVGGRLVTDPSELEPVDWVILATKAVSDPAAWLDRLVGPDTRIAVLQNGIDLRRRVRTWARPERVLPVTVTMAAERTGADEVTVVHVNDLVTETTPLAAEFADLFRPVISVRAAPDHRLEAWRKLMLNVAVNTLTTITGCSAADCIDAVLLPTTRALLRETLHVAETRGVELTWNEVDDTIERIRRIGPHLSSMQMDFRLGRPIEYRFITGAVLENAEAARVDVPVVRAMHGLLQQIAARPKAPADVPAPAPVTASEPAGAGRGAVVTDRLVDGCAVER